LSTVEKTAKAILDPRALYPESTLANLYDPVTMPIELMKAHEANNKAVDKAYGYTDTETDDASRVAFLFKKYEELTSLLPAKAIKKKRAKKADDTQANLI